MKILVTGGAGYIGYPLVEKLKTKYKEEDIIAIDNLARRKWVDRVLGKASFYGCNDSWIERYCLIGDLTDKDYVNEILKLHKPDVIIHLASQPSMPYSHLNWERANYTQVNNVLMVLNLLWGLKENGLSNTTRFIITTTTGIPGQCYQNVPEDTTINMAGSFYHISRGFDSANCNLASRLFGINVVEFRTSIVYGVQTTEVRKGLSRFDTDFYFGTALNRFIAQALKGEPLSVYGKGEQTKPFISLEDCCQSLFNAVEYKFPKGHTILNQVTECVSINMLAELVAKYTNAKVEHIPNPRKENEEFNMLFDNKKFMEVLGNPKQLIQDGIKEMVRVFK